jgi:hypothetical protein
MSKTIFRGRFGSLNFHKWVWASVESLLVSIVGKLPMPDKAEIPEGYIATSKHNGEAEWRSPYDALDADDISYGALSAKQGKVLNDDINTSIEIGYKSLDNLKQMMYRNLEGDNMLATIDYLGRKKPIETPIILIAKTSLTYTLANVPYINDILINPENWLMYNISLHGNPDLAIKITSAEYVGTIDDNDNCCIFVLNGSLDASVDARMGLFSFKASGINIRYSPAFPNTGTIKSTGCGFMWKHSSNGKYYSLNTMIYFSDDHKIKLKLHTTTDRMDGVWTPVIDNEISDFVDVLGVDYVGSTTPMNTTKVPGKDNIYIAAVGLRSTNLIINTYGTVFEIGILEFNEDLTYKKLYKVKTTYDFIYGLNSNGYGISMAYYKGKYYISFHDGEFNTGKRIVIVGDTLYGEFKYHSTILEYNMFSHENSTIQEEGGGNAKIVDIELNSEYGNGYIGITDTNDDIIFENDIIFNESNTQTATDFVTINAATLSALGITVISDANKLTFTGTVDIPFFIECVTAESIKSPGSMFSYSISNSNIFTFNNELYCITSGSSLDELCGTFMNHEGFLWKYNDNTNEWTLIVSPFIMALHGANSLNYPELPSMAWAIDHMGMSSISYVEGSKLWIGYEAKGTGSAQYIGTVGYIDLGEALK